MEWDIKMPPWDPTELVQNVGEANLSSVVGSSGSTTVLDCSVDLKLGGLGDFGMTDKWKEQRRALAMPMEMSATVAMGGQLKRPRLPSGGSQNVSCLVDGCRNDLSHCREYHRRHKVCEVHSKTPIVMVGGQEQRFCQQCSRFHLLVEFDEVKRSCRKRLDGHNRRRRKPPPDSVISANLFPKHNGTRFTSYGQIFPTAVTDSTCSTIVKSEEDAVNSHQPPPMPFINRVVYPPPSQNFGSSFTCIFKEGKQFPYLYDHNEMALSSRAALEPESSRSKIIFGDGLPPDLDSDCALSLLSSSAHTIPTGQPMLSSLEYETGLGLCSRLQATSNNGLTGFLCSGVENEHSGTVLVSDAIEADLHCQRIFHVEGEGTSDGASQFSSSWF